MPTGAIEVSRIRSALADRYRIERVLGEGGMATVYLAEDLKHRRKVAVKVMRPELAATLGSERFLREVEIAAKLSHPHILPVYDSGAADGVLYYVMPVVEGESLPARLAREKQLPVEEALRLAREVAEALAYAHSQGFVHRDIKPANILLSAGHALVADFGIARATSGDAKALTQTGLAIGTPQYMSPEQASGDPNVDGRTDIYALGCVLYEMLAGEPPFTGPTAQAIITRSITETPRALTSTRQALAPVVDRAVMRALAKAPADRYANAGEMARALEVVDRQSLMVDGQSSIDHRRSTQKWQIAAAAGAVILLGALGWKAFGQGGGGGDVVVRSVAVLPFVNLGADSNSYFADGIVDELRGKLSKLPDLTVIASTSADQYRGTDKTGPEIAKELRVDQVLSGKVQWGTGGGADARRVRVSAELVDGVTGKITWRDTFDGDVADALDMQSRMATRVASALGGVLRQEDATQLADRPTSNATAYDLFLKGRAVVSRSAADQRIAAGYFAQAVALDSTFAQAWAHLGESLLRAYTNGNRDPDLGRRAKSAIDRALTLADDKAYSHGVARLYHLTITNDTAAASKELTRALAIEPNNALLLSSSAIVDVATGGYEEAFKKFSRARELDPKSLTVLSSLTRSLTYLGRWQEAIDASAELLELAPTDLTSLQTVVLAHLTAGDLEGARSILRDALSRIPPTELVAYFSGYQEMAFVLDPRERDLLLRLTPAAFDNDPAWWGQALATAAYQQGDTVKARAYADSSLATAQQHIDANPGDPQLRALNAVMLAYVGRTDEAEREVDLAVRNVAANVPGDLTYVLLQRIRVLLVKGAQTKAIAAIEDLMQRPYFLTPGYLMTDPMFAPLKDDPRFKQLVAGGIVRSVD